MRHAFIWVALATLVGGCVGPVLAMLNFSDAEAEIAAARTADAPKWAPYEYTSATLYLHEAQLLRGYSGAYYQDAYEYAQKAVEFAKLAKEKAENHPKE